MWKTCSNCKRSRFVEQLCANVCRAKSDMLIRLPTEEASKCELFCFEDQHHHFSVFPGDDQDDHVKREMTGLFSPKILAY